MVYTTDLWWFGGSFIVLPTLSVKFMIFNNIFVRLRIVTGNFGSSHWAKHVQGMISLSHDSPS